MAPTTPAPASPSITVASTAAEAWELLRQRGLESPGRDDELVDMLHAALAGSAAERAGMSFAQVLGAASLEEFVRGFFGSAAPYVDMLKDILAWFERAKAKEGADGWKLAWDGGDIPELQYFRALLRELERRTALVELPAPTYDACLALVGVLANAPGAARALKLIGERNYRDLPAAVRQFAYHYEGMHLSHRDLPAPPTGAAWLEDVWRIIRHALTELERGGIDGRRAACARLRAGIPKKLSDGFDLGSLCLLESDYWLLQLVACYGALLESPAEQAGIGAAVEAQLAQWPRVSVLVDDSFESFAAFLELPVWARRHEFYSAWIASRIIGACDAHRLELLHDQGVIALPFRRTEVARILSARPERVLFAERREPLSDPKGKGRSENVQPDFSIWHGGAAGEACKLVVEVKHYQRPAKTSWAHVLEDYAAAHPEATVVLANYGAPGNAMAAVSADVRGRCRVIGNLRPGQPAAIEELAGLVRGAVGPALRVPGAGGSEPLAIVLDRSYSMRAGAADLRALLKRYAQLYDARWVAVAEHGRRQVWEADAQGFAALADSPRNAETQFGAILEKLLLEYPGILFITDCDGRDSLNRDTLVVHPIAREPDGIEVLHVARR